MWWIKDTASITITSFIIGGGSKSGAGATPKFAINK